MYKVFFNDRVVLITDDFIRNFQLKHGLFYKYRNVEDLKELLRFYWKLKLIDSLYIFHHNIEELQERFRSCFQMVFAAGGLVKNSEGEFLIMRRRDRWDLPKGKVHPEESFEQAALREVTEECGLHGIEIEKPMLSTYHSYYIDEQPILKRTSWFEMVYSGSETPVPQLDEDITEIRWMRQSQLPTITGNTYPAIVDVLKYNKPL
jgi:8-oxo-dGTP pyrophosphatase MutT (NUDIX family)